jgi:DNA polymerase sigma
VDLAVEVYPPMPADALVTAAADALAARGMDDVTCISTARFPLVTFRDPRSGLHVDVCSANPLAVRNTALLRAYSQCDARVRPLALVLKRWASARNLNRPRDGTLSSYGFVLMLVACLQRTVPPVLPCLQGIPAHWSPARDGADVAVPIDERDPTARSGAMRWRIADPASGWGETRALPRPLAVLVRRSLPREELENPEGERCNTYFYDPPLSLAPVGARNTSPVALLLLDFLFHYGLAHNCRAVAVSCRNVARPLPLEPSDCVRPGRPPSKSRERERERDQRDARSGVGDDGTVPGFEGGRWRGDPFAGEVDADGEVRAAWKAAEAAWPLRSVLTVEDPFETSYDVAHVLRPQTQRALRAEFVRAYVLLVHAAVVGTDPSGAFDPAEAAARLLAPAQRSPSDTPSSTARSRSARL